MTPTLLFAAFALLCLALLWCFAPRKQAWLGTLLVLLAALLLRGGK